MNSLNDWLHQRDTIFQNLKDNLHKSIKRIKQEAEKGHRELSFNIGVLILVKLYPYRQISVQDQIYSKLARRYYSPLPIVERVGEVAYRLDLSTYS